MHAGELTVPFYNEAAELGIKGKLSRGKHVFSPVLTPPPPFRALSHSSTPQNHVYIASLSLYFYSSIESTSNLLGPSRGHRDKNFRSQ